MMPTQPGYYWRKGPNRYGEMIEQVVRVDPIFDAYPEELFYWETGDIGAIYIKQEDNVEWSGLIPTMAKLKEARA